MKLFKQDAVQVRKSLLARKSRGAITVEYALGMMLAAFIMIGVFSLFEEMAVQVINEFKRYVMLFPNT